ncbi:MAG TPA: M20/M25/M40 family metallo-hydrolase [Acidimicrobiia bacterium]|nr:M20/M25/M40 family metallo-hydrolase [Acidimicrobiia bacterium]
MSTLDLLRQLISNQCVNDGTRESGHEVRSVETLADYLGERGTVVEPAPGRQSVVYRVPGDNPEAPALLLLPHLDVVPVNPDGWEVDPFAAEISDGFVWGRGAIDMLNLTAAMVVIFGEHLRGEARLPGDLILAAVADEEAAGFLGAKYLTEERLELVDAPYVLTEVGYPSLPGRDGTLFPVTVGEKGPAWTKVRSRGTPGHGSTPHLSDNALAPLTAALAGLFGAESPVLITDEWRSLVASLHLDQETARRLLDAEQIDEALSDLAVDDPGLARYFHAVTHMTISPNVVRAGIKSNMIPDHAEAEVDIRVLPGMDRELVDGVLRKLMGSAGDELELIPMADFPSIFSPRDNPLWEAIGDAVEDHTGSRSLQPVVTSATTDARFLRRRGSIAYGVGLYDDRMSFAEFLTLFHGHNERVSVDSVERTTDLLRSVLRRFGERSG